VPGPYYEFYGACSLNKSRTNRFCQLLCIKKKFTPGHVKPAGSSSGKFPFLDLLPTAWQMYAGAAF
jgi:hypothetical protein